MLRFSAIRPITTLFALSAIVYGTSLPVQAVSLYSSDNTEQQAIEWKAHTDRPFRLGNWEYIRLLHRSGADAGEPNQHPAKLSRGQIGQILRKFMVDSDNGPTPLFSESELKQLAPVVSVALEKAIPDQDVVFLTRGRYEAAGLFGLDLANAGRIFVANGKFNLILGTEHSDGLNLLRPGIPPQIPLGNGSRARQAEKVHLIGEGITWLRKDWGAVDMEAATAATVPPPVVPNNSSNESGTAIETRLRLLQRLHDENLITDAEYQQKRIEILKGL